MPRRRSASLTVPVAALRWREGPTSPLCKHLEQLIPLWLWIAPPVATEHPRRAVVTEPATHGGGWYRGRGRQIGRVGRKWRLRSRSCPLKSWIPRDHGPEVLVVPSDHLKPRFGGVFRIWFPPRRGFTGDVKQSGLYMNRAAITKQRGTLDLSVTWAAKPTGAPPRTYPRGPLRAADYESFTSWKTARLAATLVGSSR